MTMKDITKHSMKAVILAAGKSKRMKSGFSKVLHKIMGKEIINFLLDSIIEAGIDESDICIVCGDNLNDVQRIVKRNVKYTVQEQQLGTADALMAANDFIREFKGDLLVTVGDNPYITPKELKKLIAHHQEKRAECSFISAVFPFTPPPYGRVIRDENRNVLGVVEEIDASPEQLAIREVNSSIYLFKNEITYPLLSLIDNNNAKSEYYLTDIIKLLKDRHFQVEAVPTDDYFISIGINNRWELSEAQKKFNEAHLKYLSLEKGVTILQPDSVTVEYGTEIGQDTVIYPNTYIATGTIIGSNCKIGPFVYLENIKIKDNSTVNSSAIITVKEE